MSPSFDFIFGKPIDDSVGRWIHGRVVGTAGGYKFKADLVRRNSPANLQCHTVQLDVARPFRADDFGAYLGLMSTGTFETVTRFLDLTEIRGLNASTALAIREAVAPRIDRREHESLSLIQDLKSLEGQLEQLRKRELLGLALARYMGGNRSSSTEDGQ